MKHRLIAATLLAAAPASAEVEDAASVLARFLEARGEDIPACFGEMPEMEAGLDAGQFQGPDGQATVPPRRLVVAFDASGSMAGRLGGTAKIDGAREAVAAMLGGLPEDVAVGLVAFGHRGTNEESGRAESCEGVETLVEGRAGGGGAVRERLEGLAPAGWTPLAAALEAAGAQLAAEGAEGEQVVYVVSDGEETCGGDPVAAARALHEGGQRAVINVLGLDLPPEERAALEAVAAAGGGLFTAVETESDLQRQIAETLRTNRNSIERTRVRNQGSIAQTQNRNQTSIALTRLDNCVSIASTTERNRVGQWSRDEGLSEAQEATLRDRLAQKHAAYADRAAAIRREAEAARDAANSTLQEGVDDAEAAFEATR